MDWGSRWFLAFVTAVAFCCWDVATHHWTYAVAQAFAALLCLGCFFKEIG